MGPSQFETYLNIEIWNEQKDHCGFANKVVRLPFQPFPNMIIKNRVGEFCFSHLAWDITTKVFEATAIVIAGWDNEKFLDVNYYLDELRRDDWNIIHPRERHWTC